MGGGGFGYTVLYGCLAFAFVMFASPLLIVLLMRRWRRNWRAWLIASLPLLVLSGFVFVGYWHLQRERALAGAVAIGDLATVTELLDNGVSADAFDEDDRSAINSAIDCKHWDVVRALAEHGAHDTDRGDDGYYDESTIGSLEAAGRHDLAQRVRANGKL